MTGIPIDDLPVDSVYDMMQIVKHNSISGCKLASTRIVYTPHSNLKKTFEMESGTVTYHDTKLCRYKHCDKDRNRVRELEKTKTERLGVDFFEEMKANERRIVARKKLEKEKRRNDAADAKESSMDRQHEDTLGLYDPIRDDIRAGKTKASRMGDDESGLDRGLAALEGLSSDASTTTSYSNRTGMNAAGATNTVQADEPDWVQEAERRSLEPSHTVRFLRARGYDDYVDTVAENLNISKSHVEELKTLWHSNGSLPPASDSIFADAAEARQEEKEVLMAIFGEDDSGVSLSEDETEFDAIFPITSYEPPSRYESPPPLLLEVYVDNSIAPLYPFEPPVLALVGGGLPEALLKELTNRLRTEVFERCKEEPGEPQIYNVLTFVGEEVEKIIEEETVELDAKRKKRLKEEKAEAETIRKAETDEKKKQVLSSAAALFKSDAERRAYASEVISKVSLLNVNDNEKKHVSERYNTGVTDESLVKDMFG